MKSPGVTVRPLRQIGGQAEFNEVFFEEVRVPRDNLLGELHNGWQIVTSALQNERGIMYVVEMQILLAKARDQLMRLARERGAASQPDDAPGARRASTSASRPSGTPASARSTSCCAWACRGRRRRSSSCTGPS